MNEPDKALAALNAIFSLLNPASATLTQDFDTKTGEQVIRLEYRYRDRVRATIQEADAEQRQYVPLLQSMLSA